MKTPIAKRALLAAGAGLALVPLLADPALADPQEVESITDRLQQYEDRFNRGDAEALAQLFSEDVVYYGPIGRVLDGRVAVRQHYQRNLAAGFSDMTVEVIEIEVADDSAYDIARYTVSSPEGEPLTGYHLAILAKEDGEWIVQRTLVNAVMPKPPAD